jgi:nucleoside-diphosphate-sugar epimerase
MDESSPRRRLGHVYADSKIEAEEVFESLTSDGQVEGVIVRPTYVWGPNSNLFTLPFVRAIRKGQLFLVNRGTGACNAVYVDNVADLVILCGHHPRAPGNAFLVRDPDRHTWYDFFSHYARMLDRDPAEWRSVPSGWTPGRVVGMTLREPLSAAWRGLSRLVDRVEPASPTIARYVLKAPRKIIYRAKEAVDRLLPAPYGWWDLAKFSSPGFISQENSRRLLDFELRMTVREGMDETAVWLREQSHVPHSVTRSRSPAEAAR